MEEKKAVAILFVSFSRNLRFVPSGNFTFFDEGYVDLKVVVAVNAGVRVEARQGGG